MNNLIKFILPLFTMLIMVSACSKTNQNRKAATPDIPALLQAGPWKLASLTQRSEDKSGALNGYVFRFLAGGSLTAEKVGETSTGSWAYTPAAVVYYGATGSNASLRMQITGDAAFARLNKIWNIDSVHTSASTLTLVSPEIAEQETAIFLRQ
jgi:hypothetical protein